MSLKVVVGAQDKGCQRFLSEDRSKAIKLDSPKAGASKVPLEKEADYLDCQKRPKWLAERIEKAFKNIYSKSESQWDHNGESLYNICRINEHVLMKKLILQGWAEGRKTFYALDIGAGQFQWSHAIAGFIDKDPDMPKDITVHIIGVGGEAYTGSHLETTKLCRIHNLARFKIEELGKWFTTRGFHLENKIDLIVSTWCFRHLVDPVGTFLQTHTLLRPETGFLLMDGFVFLHEQEEFRDISTKHMTQLALDTGCRFLMRNYTIRNDMNHYAFQKSSEDHCRLPMKYSDTIPGYGISIQAGSILRFRREPQEGDQVKHYLLQEVFEKTVPAASQGGGNDKKMYDWLQENHLLEGPPLQWRSLLKV